MTRTDLAAILVACAALAGAVWFTFTRNGHRLAYVIALAVHRLLVPATGQHGIDQPAGVRDVLREMALAAVWHMPRYWWWRDRLGRAVRGCLHWPAGQMPRPEMLREPVAASAPGDGPALVPPSSGAGPLTDATAPVSPYPPPTEPQPRLDEPLPLASRYIPAATWEPREPSVTEVLS